jgi:hypothetical protein
MQLDDASDRQAGASAGAISESLLGFKPHFGFGTTFGHSKIVINTFAPNSTLHNWTRMALMVSSRTIGMQKVKSISWHIPEEDGCEFHIEFSAARFIRLMGKIEDIMREHNIVANHMDLLVTILGHRKYPVLFEGPALAFGQLDIDTPFFEEKMVSKLLAAVFSEDDTTARSCKPVRLVLTERSHARINLKTGTCTMILLYSEESDPQSTLRVVVSSKLGGINRYYRFLGNNQWMLRRFPLSVD